MKVKEREKEGEDHRVFISTCQFMILNHSVYLSSSSGPAEKGENSRRRKEKNVGGQFFLKKMFTEHLLLLRLLPLPLLQESVNSLLAKS